MELKAARSAIAQWSLQRAAARVGSGKRRRDDPGERVVRGHRQRSALVRVHAHKVAFYAWSWCACKAT